MVLNGAITGLKNNSYHSQELLAATMAAIAVKFGSKMKFFNEITALTAAASGVNTAGVLVGAKSAHTIWTSNDADEKKAAWKALMLATGGATVATMTRATTVLQSRHTSLPKMTEFAKPLAIATGTSVVLAEGGIRGVKLANASLEAAAERRRIAGENHEIDADIATVQAGAHDAEDKIQALPRDQFIILAKAARNLLATSGGRRNESAKVTDDQIGWINAQAAEFAKAAETKIDGWVDLAR